jgi:hypothetical protein
LNARMFPLTHTWTSGLAVLLLALGSSIPAQIIVEWVLVGAVASILLDLDHLLLPLLFSESRRKFTRIFGKPLFYLTNMDELRGILYSPGTTEARIIIHVLFITVILAFILRNSPDYFLPVAASLLTHIAFDAAETIVEPDKR